MEATRTAASGEVIRFEFGITTVEVWPEQRYLRTMYSDGCQVDAAPQLTRDYLDTAQRLGYGDDTWAMCVEHEIMHTLLAMADGRAVSPALWAVAHRTEDVHREIIAKEEDYVMSMQRKLNECRKSVTITGGD